ncbi:hypothetical protein FBU59_002669 [Linderina macrospora]|uniref:Uncharacterized protein n=1 Tax=Linderina macrospora TaxID=4868 RepID=A0ACC1JAH0_9FUNG|nr:hypothetical protein FBU59_002669 [Linderina macrospora]
MKLSTVFGISLVAAALALPQPSTLRKRATQLHKRIVGGEDASINGFRFAASIVLSSLRGITTRCNGIILSDEYVATVTSCFYNPNGDKVDAVKTLLVGYGSINTDVQARVEILETKEHPNFKMNTLENNIAVIKVEKMDFEGTGAAAADIYKGAFRADMGAATIGWGTTDDRDKTGTTTTLKKADVYIGADNKCRVYERVYLIGTFTSSNDATICIDKSKSVGNGPCANDEGDALIITTGGRQQVAGIYSYGGGPDGNTQCAASYGFDYYQSLNKQLSFIQTATGLSL